MADGDVQRVITALVGMLSHLAPVREEASQVLMSVRDRIVSYLPFDFGETVAEGLGSTKRSHSDSNPNWGAKFAILSLVCPTGGGKSCC
jgi:hypothetical protein